MNFIFIVLSKVRNNIYVGNFNFIKKVRNFKMLEIIKEITWMKPSKLLRTSFAVITTLIASTIIIGSLDFIFGLTTKFIIERFL